MRVGLITLGCDKNTVDNEYLAGLLEVRGCEVVFLDRDDNGTACDTVVVLTCGFIGDAKEQSIVTLVRLAENKTATGSPKRVFAAGCLAQRYADELLKEIPELDAVIGVGQWEEVASRVVSSDCARNVVRATPSVVVVKPMRRKRSGNLPHAYLKISDGCDHACSFCAIPAMKGRLRSVPSAILLEEARALIAQGARELVLVGQDVAAYGRDWGQGNCLAELLRALCRIEGDFWIRCMYCYPAGVTDELLDTIAAEPKVVPYLDIPLQHIDPETLRRMKRPAWDMDTAALVERIRSKVPGITLRTTMLVGFPGETRQAHKAMIDGIRALRFQWLGAFQYSREEGTTASVEARQVRKDTKERRWHAVMQTQAVITEQLNQARVGTRTRVLVEEFVPAQDAWLGRTPVEAPEVDGCVLLPRQLRLTPGEFVDVEITDAHGYDVMAEPI